MYNITFFSGRSIKIWINRINNDMNRVTVNKKTKGKGQSFMDVYDKSG